MLQSSGYYHITGYLHPYRLVDPHDPTGHRRLDAFRPGTDLVDVGILMDFDRRLRTVLLDGTQLVEVAIRARIAHELRRRSPFAHTDQSFLSPVECVRWRTRQGVRQSAFHAWMTEYGRLQQRSREEPFVRHNLECYGEPLPIWIACEFLDFGAVSHLYQLMPDRDRIRIAQAAGVPSERTLRSWLASLNYVRNVCAHNKRLWNRILTVKPRTRPCDLPVLLTSLGQQSDDRVYGVTAITAYLTSRLCPDSEWFKRARMVLGSFPQIPLRSISEMGVPANWVEEPLWNELGHDEL
ncbi:MAG: Abi family protein [Propionibacteriaceae bacterium]|nr:Abi family protein [Propionibacteriaceae bacterium]